MSESDRRRDRDRSRSPRRERKSKSSSGGFRWKEKKKADDAQSEEPRQTGRIGGYRNRDYNDQKDRSRQRRDSDHDREETRRDEKAARSRDMDQSKYQNEAEQQDSRKAEPAPSEAATAIDNDILSKFGASAAAKFSKSAAAKSASTPKDDPDASTATVDTAKSARNKDSRPKAAGPRPGEPMILVKVNDRLGTAAQIPCYASDNVGLFKAQVAARIGRRPHEILLKRQGERPFKDVLTLEDYGVSNGVQIDLELAT